LDGVILMNTEYQNNRTRNIRTISPLKLSVIPIIAVKKSFNKQSKRRKPDITSNLSNLTMDKEEIKKIIRAIDKETTSIENVVVSSIRAIKSHKFPENIGNLILKREVILRYKLVKIY